MILVSVAGEVSLLFMDNQGMASYCVPEDIIMYYVSRQYHIREVHLP